MLKNGFIVAGSNSGCGKTTISMGLMRLLADKGFEVAPFKTGPDYIDPAFHQLAAKRVSHNLDAFLMDESALKYLYNHYAHDCHIAVIEGVMGLFDGMGDLSVGSTAHLAKMLGVPVLLVVNGKGMFQSIAAMVKGFAHFDPELNLAGVIINNVTSESHYVTIKNYVEQHTNVPCLGYLPPLPNATLNSRHLGLIQADEVDDIQQKIESIAAKLADTLDVDRLLRQTTIASIQKPDLPEQFNNSLHGLNLAVAFDKAFRFYYQANLDLLVLNGAKIYPFSPLVDEHLPAGINALYIGGGYPEVFAHQLAGNNNMRQHIQQIAADGIPIYAECGGLMYLTDEMELMSGEKFSMCGVIPAAAKMTERLQNFGYCLIDWDGDSIRAHEFHRSVILPLKSNLITKYRVHKPLGEKYWSDGYAVQNTLAAYQHIHFYSDAHFFKKITKLWMQKTI
jgi:cobyrinic acid a,c-diamide synthase